MQNEREILGRRAVIVGLLSNLILAIIKSIVGVIGNSPALLADGINSTSDVAYYVAVSVFMRRARKPADEEHPYGHDQLESIGALVVGSFVITTAIAILNMPLLMPMYSLEHFESKAESLVKLMLNGILKRT